MAYWIHGHVCHIWRPKLGAQFSENLIYGYFFNSDNRVSKEEKIMEGLIIRNSNYDRNFQFTNSLVNTLLLFVLNK